MEILDINDVTPGRRLARAVYTAEGKLLLSIGEMLTEDRLKMLRKNGFSSLAVEERSNTLRQPPEYPGDIMHSVRAAVKDRFRQMDLEEDHTQVLFNLALERQGRMTLSKPGKLPIAGKSSPAFQTQRPPKVAMKPLVESSQRMGTLPMVFHRLVEIINDPNATADEIARIISIDPALTAKLLKLVNSPFYGLAQKIDTISRAVVIVGTRQLVMLAMGATLITAFKGVPVSLINMQSFWSHSISCGVTARQFARFAGISQPESFFVSGLLHDIARLLVYTQLPGHALYFLTEAKRRQEPVHDMEKETLGFTHEELGGELLRSWRCPPDLVERVQKHHMTITESTSPDEVVLPAANTLAQALGYGSSGEIFLLPLSPLTWTKLGMSPGELQEQCALLDDKIRQVRAFFAPS